MNIDPDDTVKAFMKVKRLGEDVAFTNSHYIVMGTKKGVIKKSLLADYSRPRQNGVIALTVKEDDELISARLTNGSNEVLLLPARDAPFDSMNPSFEPLVVPVRASGG